MRIYTRAGDDGTTGIQGGARVSKTDPRIAAYGAVDEVNASVGVAVTEVPAAAGPCDDIGTALVRIQNDLFELGADLSDPGAVAADSGRVLPGMVGRLEADIDVYESELEPLASFILPGGTRLAALLHASRTAARRAEVASVRLRESARINPECVRYLNRLSDLFFVMARTANRRAGAPDTVWRQSS